MSTQTDVQAHPILFSAEMVRAILDGQKTQTRRVVKRDFEHDPNGPFNGKWYIRRAPSGTWDSYETQAALIHDRCPYGKPGDLLWVRESFRMPDWADDMSPKEYTQAGGGLFQFGADNIIRTDCGFVTNPIDVSWGRLRPSIHMPRALCRLTLEVTDVRVERLHEITDKGVQAEGVTADGMNDFNGFLTEKEQRAGAFADVWDDTYADRGHGWEANPWVWVISFEKA